MLRQALQRLFQLANCVPTAGTGGGRSGTADASPASRATAPRFPEPRAHRSAHGGYRAKGGRDYLPAALAAAPALPRLIRQRHRNCI